MKHTYIYIYIQELPEDVSEVLRRSEVGRRNNQKKTHFFMNEKDAIYEEKYVIAR